MEAKLIVEQLKVSASYLLCLTDNPQGDLVQNADNGLRYIPLLKMNEVLRTKEITMNAFAFENILVVNAFNNKSVNSSLLFAVTVEDNSMQPQLSPGDQVILDGQLQANPGNTILVHLTQKNQTWANYYALLISRVAEPV